MSQREMTVLLLVAFNVACGNLASSSGQERERASPPIRQVDHIMIRAEDPEPLYSFFTKTLELPVAWPLTTYAFTTGGVGFGEVNVEVIGFSKQMGSARGKPSESQLVGIALEPSRLAESLADLAKRGITYGEPRPRVSTRPDGSKENLWTNVTLRQFSDADRVVDARMHVFLCEYSPSFVKVEERRKRLREQLTANKGGPLGVHSVKEITIGTTDLEKAKGLWLKLLEPTAPSTAGVWQFGSGPAIRLIRAEDNTIRRLVISVDSLPKAKAFLREAGLLGPDSEEEVTIDPSKIEGLDIRLVGKE